jgi:hypothetical protein
MHNSEEWLSVPGYDDVYEISNTGSVRRSGKATRAGKGRGGGARIGRILRQHCGSDGYYRVQLWMNGTYKNFLTHRLVALAFLGPEPSGCEVNHISGVKSDNSSVNLEYVTRSENNLHAYRLGLMVNNLKFKGETHPNAKLTENQVQEIREQYRPGSRLHGSVALGRKYGVDHKTILQIVKREIWNS